MTFFKSLYIKGFHVSVSMVQVYDKCIYYTIYSSVQDLLHIWLHPSASSSTVTLQREHDQL